MTTGTKEIYIQTWSGNIRMIKTAEKLGFKVVQYEKNKFTVNGNLYDDVVFKLDQLK